jgi:hypothetical protein
MAEETAQVSNRPQRRKGRTVPRRSARHGAGMADGQITVPIQRNGSRRLPQGTCSPGAPRCGRRHLPRPTPAHSPRPRRRRCRRPGRRGPAPHVRCPPPKRTRSAAGRYPAGPHSRPALAANNAIDQVHPRHTRPCRSSDEVQTLRELPAASPRPDDRLKLGRTQDAAHSERIESISLTLVNRSPTARPVGQASLSHRCIWLAVGEADRGDADRSAERANPSRLLRAAGGSPLAVGWSGCGGLGRRCVSAERWLRGSRSGRPVRGGPLRAWRGP